jgi:hypothetical protein
MMKPYAFVIAVPMAALIAVGNLAHVDAASGTEVLVTTQQGRSASQDAYSSSWTIVVAAAVARAVTTAIAVTATQTQADSAQTSAATEATPVTAFVLGLTPNLKETIRAVQLAEVHTPTQSERLLALND